MNSTKRLGHHEAGSDRAAAINATVAGDTPRRANEEERDGRADIRHFLVVFHIPTGEAKARDFGTNYAGAVEAYAEIEEEMHGREDLEIVLLGADSLETVQRTHSSYFATGETFEALLPEGVLSR